MFNEPQTALILGGTGRTGSLVAKMLTERGLSARTASRHGSDVLFDWDDTTTHADALAGVDRVYLVTPIMRVTYADQVAAFLDLAEATGVRHVTYLSTYNGDKAPQEVDIAAVETGLAHRQAITHSILRPAWVMQNFSDEHLPVIDGAITVPTGGGTETFVDAADIAAVAVETLLHPDAHAGAQYAPTGPQALTVSEVADIIASVSGRPVSHHDIDRDTWINGAVAAASSPPTTR
ncbi:NmrA family NAD(P)-binding protein [Streptosporangium lutulentum]